MKKNIVIYNSEDGNIRIDVFIEEETIWLNLNQISELFARDTSVIRKHIRNVLTEEGDEESNRQFLPVANSDKLVPFYNLDVIISIGYRVKSQRGIKFRRWANKILREYLLQGYVINPPRVDYIQKTTKIKFK